MRKEIEEQKKHLKEFKENLLVAIPLLKVFKETYKEITILDSDLKDFYEHSSNLTNEDKKGIKEILDSYKEIKSIIENEMKIE